MITIQSIERNQCRRKTTELAKIVRSIIAPCIPIPSIQVAEAEIDILIWQLTQQNLASNRRNESKNLGKLSSYKSANRVKSNFAKEPNPLTNSP